MRTSIKQYNSHLSVYADGKRIGVIFPHAYGYDAYKNNHRTDFDCGCFPTVEEARDAIINAIKK